MAEGSFTYGETSAKVDGLEEVASSNLHGGVYFICDGATNDTCVYVYSYKPDYSPEVLRINGSQIERTEHFKIGKFDDYGETPELVKIVCLQNFENTGIAIFQKNRNTRRDITKVNLLTGFDLTHAVRNKSFTLENMHIHDFEPFGICFKEEQTSLIWEFEPKRGSRLVELKLASDCDMDDMRPIYYKRVICYVQSTIILQRGKMAMYPDKKRIVVLDETRALWEVELATGACTKVNIGQYTGDWINCVCTHPDGSLFVGDVSGHVYRIHNGRSVLWIDNITEKGPKSRSEENGAIWSIRVQEDRPTVKRVAMGKLIFTTNYKVKVYKFK